VKGFFNSQYSTKNIQYSSTMKNRNFDLQDRLIKFSLLIMKVVDNLPKTYAGQHFAKQLVRSGTSPAFQYGEAKSAESRKDFIHKVKIGKKELGESYICLQIIKQHPLLESEILDGAINECDELSAIFHKSIATARNNLNKNS
tara:strand:+ start:41348 stop:41776 length:429 start_codon:yes stop_codon:yes gene_type:complete